MDRTVSERLERQSPLVALELNRYNIDKAALSETRLPKYDSFSDRGYTFFCSGKGSQEGREFGIGFAIKGSITRQL